MKNLREDNKILLKSREKTLASHDLKKKKTPAETICQLHAQTLKFTKSKLKYMKFSELLIKRKSILMVNIYLFFLLKIRYKHARIKD